MYVGVLLGSIQTIGAKRAQERVSDFSVRNGECGNAKKTIDGMLKSLCLLYRLVIDKSLFFGVGRGREWIACTMHLGPRACGWNGSIDLSRSRYMQRTTSLIRFLQRMFSKYFNARSTMPEQDLLARCTDVNFVPWICPLEILVVRNGCRTIRRKKFKHKYLF